MTQPLEAATGTNESFTPETFPEPAVDGEQDGKRSSHRWTDEEDLVVQDGVREWYANDPDSHQRESIVEAVNAAGPGRTYDAVAQRMAHWKAKRQEPDNAKELREAAARHGYDLLMDTAADLQWSKSTIDADGLRQLAVQFADAVLKGAEQ